MSNDFAGAGTPPPKTGGGGGGGNWPKYGFSEKIQAKDKDGKLQTYDRRIFAWKLKLGEEKRPILLLDPPGGAHRYAVLIHEFIADDGKFGSALASIHRQDPLGDPMNDALAEDGKPREPAWCWAMTGIDMSKYTHPKTGKVYTDRRVVVLVRERQKDQFLGMEKMGDGFRGRIFEVSRPNDQQSPKIGQTWDPIERLSEEQMRARFEKAAADYGMPLDKFLAPLDYKAIFATKSRDELLKIAAEITAFRASKAAVKVAEADEEAVPF